MHSIGPADNYLDKGYIRKVDPAREDVQSTWYLPHFFLIRPDRTTTKTRLCLMPQPPVKVCL